MDTDTENTFDDAFGRTVELGNDMAQQEQEANPWDIADGLLAGAIQYWLFTHQPCGDHACEDCAPISTAEVRLKDLLHLVEQFARESEYFHSPQDVNIGRA